MRRSPVVLGIVAGLLAGAGAAAAVAVAGRQTAKPKLVVTAAPSLNSAGSAGSLGAPTVGVGIIVKGSLPELGGEARAYRLGSAPATGSIERLAAAFGVHGAVQTDAGGWVIRDGQRLVRVQRAPGLPWFLSTFNGPCQLVPGSAPGRATPAAPNEPLQTIPPTGPTDCPVEGGAVSSGVAVACPVDQPCPTPTTEPPMALDPEAPAVDALTKAGLGDHYAVVATKGPSSGHVSASPSVEGRPVSGLDWSATISAAGEITAASGFLGRPEATASYPLIGTTGGLERLKRSTPVPLLGRACPAGAPCPAPPPFSLTVTNVRLGLLRSGEHLLPAYLFELEGSRVQAVPAVEDKYLVEEQPPVPLGKPVPAPR